MFELKTTTRVWWRAQVLTLDYLIEGDIDPEKDRALFRMVGHDVQPIPMFNARFQSTGALSVPERPAAPWVLVNGDSVVAIIPRDEAGIANAVQMNGDENNASPCEAYVGPYLIRGMVQSPFRDLRYFSGQVGFVVTDAEITCLSPGAQFAGLKAPVVMVISPHKQHLAPIH